MEDFDICMAQAMILLVLCRRHLVNCQKAVYHLVSRTRMKSCAAAQQRLRKKRRLIINLLMDLQQVQRQLGNGGRRWMLPRFRKHWFEREVMKMAPKEDGVPVMEFGEFEVVGFPFSRLSREMAERSASSADSIEVIGPECADLAAPAAAEQPPPPVQITELTGPSAAPAPDTDGDWEIVPPRQQAAAAPAPPPPPPPLAFGAEPVRTPRVTWWQDGGHVRLCVHLSDARQPLVDIQPTHFHFSCEQAGCRFVVAIDLFSAVRPQDSSYQVLGAHVQVKLRKEKALSWRRLTAVPVKARWLQHDLEHLAGGDSSSDETYLPLVSPAPAPLPLEALRRGRAPQPEPAEGAAVTSSSEDSDEDMEHGFGGAAGASDLKLLNDPEAVRDLLQPDPWASGGL